ncbi:TPA: glycosyltransferase [Streptococcus suis]|nr:glycosyltransferase [Streptococcus suis]HEM4711359.1 glycosyltransferase [Streptococcus suis]HEM4755473.1 glycosyltransferase [Streptococcus suis]
MSKIRVMHLLKSNRYSGAENVVCQIIESTRNQSNDYEMIYVSPKGPIEGILEDKDINFFGLNNFTQKEIGRAIDLLNPDIIHAHDFSASVRVSKYNRKIISHLHNNPTWFSKLDYRTLIYTFSIHRFKRIIGVSRSIQNEYIFKNKLNKKFLVLPNVVDKTKVLNLANEESYSSDLLFVGRLSREKDPLFFLQIVKKLVESNPNIQAIMVGDGALLNECEEYIVSNSLFNNVKMVGFEQNPYKYMSKTKILIMTSVYEGFGLVAIEAMLLGKPVVCRLVGGLVDILDNETGAFCTTIDEFVFTITQLLANSSDIKLRETKAVERAQRYCDISSFQQTLDTLYKEILGLG